MAKLRHMGRGLSELQKTMLMMSKAERVNWKIHCNNPEWQKLHEDTYNPDSMDSAQQMLRDKFSDTDNWQGRIYFGEVLAQVYRWPIQEIDYHFRPSFSKKEIGANRYMAAYIAVYKAAQRLEKREMIKIIGKEYHITPKGEAYLSAKLIL